MSKTLKRKTADETLETPEVVKAKQWERPAQVVIDCVFEEGNRKVTPADLERAAEAAASAFRTSLEARTPAYRIADLKVCVSYAYVAIRKTFTA